MRKRKEEGRTKRRRKKARVDKEGKGE